MTPELKQARVLLAKWVGPDDEPRCRAGGPGRRINAEYGSNPSAPMWLDADGFHTTNPHCVSIEAWSVVCALAKVGLGHEAWELLERVVKPPAGLQTWLRASDRTTGQVLEMLTQAIKRSKKGERA